MGMREKVLDLSQYDLATLDAACMAAEGVEGVILGVFSRGNPPEDMARAAAALRAAGIPILGFYGLVYFGSKFGAYRDTRWAIELAQRFGVERVWLDCEIDGYQVGFTDVAPATPASRAAELRECVRLVEKAGLKAGIYTAAWWWNPEMGGTVEFARLPLWFANYGSNDPAAPRDVIERVAFGGWAKAAVHQYSSVIPVCGRGRDHNYYLIEEEADDMGMIEELKARMDRLEALAVANGIEEWVTDANRADLQEAGATAEELTHQKVKLQGEVALRYAALRGWSVALGLGQVRDRVAALEARPSAELPAVLELEGGTLKVKVSK